MIWYYCNIHELHVTSYVLMHFLLSLPFLLPFFFFPFLPLSLLWLCRENQVWFTTSLFSQAILSWRFYFVFTLLDIIIACIHVIWWSSDFLFIHSQIHRKKYRYLLDKAPSLTLAQQWSFNIKWLHLTSSLSSIRRSEEGITLLQCHKALFPFGRFGRKQWTYNRRSEKCCSKAILTSR